MPEHSTAKILGAFYRDLRAEGFDSEEAFEIVRRAAADRIPVTGIVVWEGEIDD